MKKIFLYLILLFPCFVIAQGNNQAQKDSLRRVIAASEGMEKFTAYIYLTNAYYHDAIHDEHKRDTLFALFDEMDAVAEKLNNDNARGTIRVNKLQVLNGAQQYDEVVKLAPAYLAFAEKKQLWRAYFRLCDPLISTYRNQGRENEALDLTQKMYDYAKEKESNFGMGMALFTMSEIYGQQYQFTKQEKCLREAIALLQDDTFALNTTADAYYRLGNCLNEQKRYDEALQIANEMEAVIERFEEASHNPQPIARSNQCIIYIGAYQGLKQYDKSEFYCNELERISNGNNIYYEAKAYILASRGQYAEALEMAEKTIEQAQPKMKPNALRTKMTILLKKEGRENLNQLFEEIIDLFISEHQAEFNSKLDEIRTLYEVDKLNAEKEKITAQKERNLNYFLFALGGCVLLAIALGIWIYHSRTIVRKNRGLYRQIKEQDRLAEELEMMTTQYEKISQLISPALEKETQWDVETQLIASLQGNQQQRQLVSRLREYLLKERYFTTSDIDIQKLITEMASNRAYFFEALKVVAGKTPMEFINFLRLDEAKRLLENTSLTIENIALDCGFNSVRTFYRQFQEQYQITPAEYRKITERQIERG